MKICIRRATLMIPLVIVGLMSSALPVHAVIYAPGETLDPACAPLDADCGVASVGVGSAGQVPYYAANGAALTATSSITILADGSVGIGTTTPRARLEIGTATPTGSGGITMSTTANYPNFTNFFTTATTTLYAGDYIVPQTTTSQARAVAVTNTGTVFSTYPNFFTTPFSGETYTVYRPSLNVANGKLVVQGSTGNVGIGNVTPMSRLHISGNRNAMIYQTQLDPMPDGSNYDVGGILYTDHWLRDNITYYYAPSAYMKIVSINTNGSFPAGVRGTQLEFGTANGNAGQWNAFTRMTITADGDIGVGTSTPSAKFMIKGGGTTSGANFQTRNSSNAALFTILDSGNTGIATTTPGRKLTVVGTVGFTGLTASVGNGSLCLTTAGDVVYNATSDNCLSSTRETKHDIESLALSELSMLEDLNPVSFVYNGDEEERTRYGFIADEADAVDAHLATRDAAGKLSGLDTSGFLALIVGAVQELSEKVSGFAVSFTTRDLNADKLCLGSTCVTEDELQRILSESSQQAPMPVPTAPEPIIPDEEPAQEPPAPEPAPTEPLPVSSTDGL